MKYFPVQTLSVRRVLDLFPVQTLRVRRVPDLFPETHRTRYPSK